MPNKLFAFFEEDDIWESGKIVFNRYKLDKVRPGGFSEVWKAEDKIENIIVAIKRPKIDVFEKMMTDEIRMNLNTEFLNLLKLPRHRNITYLHGIEILISKRVGKIPCLIMDYYEYRSEQLDKKKRECEIDD